MSAATPRLPDYLQHIIEAIERIQRYTEDMDELGFAQNQMVQDAVSVTSKSSARRVEISSGQIPALLPRILSCRFHSLTKCAMCSFTATSRLISA